MGGLRALIAIGAASLMASTAAQAADMLPAPPALKGTIIETGHERSGWYLRGDMGVPVWTNVAHKSTFISTLPPIPGFRTVYTDLDGGAFVGAGAGFRFNSWFRADVTGEYRSRSAYSSLNRYTGGPGSPCIECYDKYRANLHGGVFLANGYLDLGTWAGVTPFVGVGVGMAYSIVNNFTDHNVTTGTGFAFAPRASNWAFAWAAMAGLSYAVTPNLHLEMGYRYLDRGRTETGPNRCANGLPSECYTEIQSVRLVTHDLRFGMRWALSDAPSAPRVATPIFSRF